MPATDLLLEELERRAPPLNRPGAGAGGGVAPCTAGLGAER